MFFVRHALGDRPPAPHQMRDLNPRNPFDVWRRGDAAPHTVQNILRACKLYRGALPKYKLIHGRLMSERSKVCNLRRAIRRHRRSARKRVTTRSLSTENVENLSALSDAEWSVAALEREEGALTDFLQALCSFIGTEEYDFDEDDFENHE